MRAMHHSWGVSHEATRGGEGLDRYEQEHTVGKELREGAGAESSPKKPGGTGCTAGSWCARGSGCSGVWEPAEGLADVLARRGGQQGLAPPP